MENNQQLPNSFDDFTELYRNYLNISTHGIGEDRVYLLMNELNKLKIPWEITTYVYSSGDLWDQHWNGIPAEPIDEYYFKHGDTGMLQYGTKEFNDGSIAEINKRRYKPIETTDNNGDPIIEWIIDTNATHEIIMVKLVDK